MKVVESCWNSSPVAESISQTLPQKTCMPYKTQNKATLYLPPMQTLDPGSSLVSITQNYPIQLLKTAFRTLRKHLHLSHSTAFEKVTQLKEQQCGRHLSYVFMFYFNLLFFDTSVETYKPAKVILYTNNLTYAKV